MIPDIAAIIASYSIIRLIDLSARPTVKIGVKVIAVIVMFAIANQQQWY
jgi:hypothetical protein